MADVKSLLQPQTAADLAAAGLLPQPEIIPAPPVAPPADVAAAAMPPLEPAQPPSPLMPPEPMPQFDVQAPPVGATLADLVQVPAGGTIERANVMSPAAAPAGLGAVQGAAQPVLERSDPLAQIQAADAVVEQFVAKNVAKQKQAQAVEAQAADEELERKEAAALEARIAEIDAQPQVRNLAQVFDKGSFGEKIGAALSLMAGGIAQGMLGLKSNPALDTINALVEQQAAKNKLNAEEKASLRKQFYDNILLRLKKKEALVDNELKRSQIAENFAQVQNLRNSAAAEQAKLASARAISGMLAGSAVPAATPQIAAKNQQIEAALQHLDATDAKIGRAHV